MLFLDKTKFTGDNDYKTKFLKSMQLKKKVFKIESLIELVKILVQGLMVGLIILK